MKKLDLHIHTISTVSDRTFEFCIDTLKAYVEQMELDAIAITNHNLFDKEQFAAIERELPSVVVFPGIEINIGQNAGHLIVISDRDKLDDFSRRCAEVEERIQSAKDSISVEQFAEIFPKREEYLLVPHLEKKPAVDKKTLLFLQDDIVCGEVGSVKKFIYYHKDEDCITPVYFSDYRPTTGSQFPTRQTYFDIDCIDIKAIKLCLMDKRKIALSPFDGHEMFLALPDLPMSSGLNVVIGERSSGKSFTLNRLADAYDNIKYIKQFGLLEVDPSKSEAEFKSHIAAKQSSITRDYFLPFSHVIDDVKEISLDEDEGVLDRYIKSLLKHAEETERADSFSACALYSENEFTIPSLDSLKELISSVEKLLDARQYRHIIEKNIPRENLVNLLRDLIFQYREEKKRCLMKSWVNDLLNSTKRQLQSRTAATRVADVDFYQLQMNRRRVMKFEDIAKKIKEPVSISEQSIENFTVQILKKPYSGAGEMKQHSKKMMTFSNIYGFYSDNPYRFLQGLKEIPDLSETEYYEYFAKVEYHILNQYGFDVSGGERAEFNLLQEINDAYQFDMLLIDEPESSFDNLFLRDRVNHIIKDIAGQLPVVLVTHNSTVGASIKPDYLIHTKRIINDRQASFKVYHGHPTSKELHAADGSTIRNLEATMDCLEAGEEAYKERNREYEMLRD